jgi:hypothetical protein
MDKSIKGVPRMKLNRRILFGTSHIFVFILSLVSAFLIIVKVPHLFSADHLFSDTIHFTDAVFDTVTRLFLLGICSLYTTFTIFWSFRSWPYLSAGLGIATVLTIIQIKAHFHPFLYAIFVLIGLFQIGVASYLLFLSKKQDSQTS